MIKGRHTNLGSILSAGDVTMLHSVLMTELSNEQRRSILMAYNRRKRMAELGQDGRKPTALVT